MVDDVAALLNDMPPEALQQLLGLGTLDEQDALLQQQLAQAEALRQGPQRYSTPTGAALGGLGQVLSTLGTNYRQGELMGQRSDLLSKKDKGRERYASLMAEMLRKRQAQDAADAQQGQQLAGLSFDTPTLVR